MWEALEDVVEGLDEDESTSWAKSLLEWFPVLGCKMGKRYEWMVSWCLDLDGHSIVKEDDFIKKVLDSLEDMITALS